MSAYVNIVLLTSEGGFFGQHMKPWISMDVASMGARLAEHGFQTQTMSIEEVAHDVTRVRDSVVVYTSTQRPGYKDFVEDVLLILLRGNNTLVPSFDMFRAHENKGYQELLKTVRGISNVHGRYFSSLETATDAWRSWPAVLKWPAGAKSSAVRLVEDPTELRRVVSIATALPMRLRVRELFSKYILRNPMARSWYTYIRPRPRFVLQELVPNLQRDFKVLIFGRKYFVLQRDVRQGDFRASGSGKFNFVPPPPGLLDFAADVFDRFAEPFLSLDVCETRTGFALIEFQGVHFGPYTLVHSPFHYQRDDQRSERWLRIDGQVTLEREYADAIAEWLRRQQWHYS